jgi:AraC family transcriptional regulator
MEAEIDILYSSDFYQIRNFKCNCTKCNTSGKEYTSSFCVCFVRSGYFQQNIFRKAHDVHIGRVLVAKPGIEHVTRHIDNQPDVCTVFHFETSFYEQLKNHYNKELNWFINNPDIHSVLVQTSPEIDYLHQCILNSFFQRSGNNLLMDDLVVEMLEKIINVLANTNDPPAIPNSLKKYHLTTVEKAKFFMLNHFENNISLQQLAEYCCVSLFHFSRIFKSIAGLSPHQYLQRIRLHHASVLLQSTKMPVTLISDQCGFNSLEYFTTAYRERFKTTPSAFRKNQAKS